MSNRQCAQERERSSSLGSGGSSARSPAAKSFSSLVTWIVLSEFVTVAFVAFLASIIYARGLLGHWPSAQVYLPSSLVIATAVLLVAIGFQNFTQLNILRRDRFLWSGLGATVLAFSFFQSALFLLKIAETYSRGTFLIQFLGVALTVLGLRAVIHARLRTTMERGL